jgi:hypothetical protein
MDMHCPEGAGCRAQFRSMTSRDSLPPVGKTSLRYLRMVGLAHRLAHSNPNPATPFRGLCRETFGVLSIVLVGLDNLFKCASYQATLQCKPLSQVGVYKTSAQDLEIGRRCISPRQFFASLHSSLTGVSWSRKAWSKEI